MEETDLWEPQFKKIVLDSPDMKLVDWVSDALSAAGIEFFNGRNGKCGRVGMGEQWIAEPRNDCYGKASR